MSVLRCVLAVVAIAAATTTVALLGWPGWSTAPLVVVVISAAAYAIAAAPGRRRRRWIDAAVAVSAGVLAVLTAVTAILGVDDHSDRGGRIAGADTSVISTASETVRMLFTFGPADYTAQAAQRRADVLTPRLTDRLLADYRSQGPDVILPAAVASGASVVTTVESIGVGDTTPDTVRLLVFAAERITVAALTPPTSTVPIVRWAVMRRVDETWRLADMYPAGIGG